MIKKIILLCAAFMMITVNSAAVADDGEDSGNMGLGISVPVFIMHMKIAARKVKWGFSSSRIENEMIRTEDGNYVAEYNDAILLYLNTMPGTKMLRNIALSFTIAEGDTPMGFSRGGLPNGEDQYESICQQVIMAFDPHISQKETRRMLGRLGLYGPVLDGRQRYDRRGGLAYIMKLQNNGTIVLVVSGI
ncbi:hypothetical protein [Cloacibacillus evryensis]|uniref:hypothetical protein n=1 Tax=Cloacibacillus evryensis TaxID=508460 RepID=UPI0026DF5B77|nr:hypothetical protein [Cloacibacillus evryensis]